MRKRFAESAKKLKSNRGSGIITVLVAMLFISILGATLLFTSYTGYRVKIADRGGKESFYSATAAMDEIKVGIQQAVTESLSTAYTDVLSEYTALSADGDAAVQNKFSDIFVEDLMEWKTGSNAALFSYSSPNYYYVEDTMLTFLSPIPAGSVVEVSAGSGAVTKVTGADGSLEEIILEDISVSYKSADGYQSAVTTDVVISMPDFHATTSTVVSSGLPSYALIAEDTLTVESALGNRNITGSAFADSIDATTANNILTFKSGTLVCAEDAIVSNSATLKTEPGTEFWVGNIVLGTSGATDSSGTAKLFGRSFVADDLTLQGNGSSAELKGSYCGFGSGNNAAKSSAIVVNGKNTILDIDSLERLILAGVAFVDTQVDSTESSVRTGESVSAKSDQLAYLIDKSCITVSSYFDNNGNGVFDTGDTEGSVTGINPCVFSGDHISYSIDTDNPLWGGTRTLGYYGVTSTLDPGTGSYTYSGVTPVFKNLAGTGGYRMAYFFINFGNQADANQYFRDYFSARPDKISEYIGVYVRLSNTAANTATAGNSLYTNNSGILSVLANSISVNVAGRESQFSNRCQTLNPSKASIGSTPYTYFVNEAAIPSGITEFTMPGETSTVARVVSGDYTITAAEKTNGIKVIIATGDVTVSDDFVGLIISGDDIVLNADVSYSPYDVQDIIYNSVDSSGKLLSAYLLNTVAGGGGSPITTTSWDLDLLVSYNNWDKH